MSEMQIIIATEESTALGRKVAAELDLEFTEILRKRFADGECYHAFPHDVSGKDVIIIASTHNDTAQQELLDLIAGVRYWNGRSVNVVVPYLGYSTMERAKPESGEIPKGVTRTRQIYRTRPDFVTFIDLHSEAVLHAHSGDVRTRHIWTDKIVTDKIRSTDIRDYVLVSPDYGFSKRVARLAGLLGCAHTAADKDRYDIDKTIVGQISSVVRGKTAIICDDMIRTGGSIAQTAARCREAGAIGIMVMATHLVLAGNVRERLQDQGIKRIIGSDSYPGRESDGLLDIYSVAPLISWELRRHLQLRKLRDHES